MHAVTMDKNQNPYLRVIFIICPGQQHHTRPHKARQVIHMAVGDGIIPSHPLPEPDDLLQAQVLLQGFLDALSAQVRVSAGMEQALLCAD